MAELRIKGQETQVFLIEDGDPQLQISAIRNTDITFDLELLEEGYLGETFNRVDSVFNTVSVKFEAHLVKADLIRISGRIVDKAKRRIGAGTRIDMLTNFVFPEGDLIAIGVRDIQFAPIPISIAGRADFVSVTMDGKASEYEFTE